MWESLLGVRHNGCPISDVSAAAPGLSVQNVSKAELPGNRGRRLLQIRGGPDDFEDFEAAAEAHDTIRDIQRISDATETEAFFALTIGYDEDNPSVLSILNSMGVFHHGGSIQVQSGVEHWLVYTEEKSTIQRLAAEIRSYDNEVTLFRTVDLDDIGHESKIEFGMLLSTLTGRQRDAFRTALELGYYEADSSTTVEDIASVLDVHETTAWEHLKKAENAILTDVGRRLFSELQPKEA